MKQALVLAMALLAAPAGVVADAVDEFLKGHMERHRIPGLSLAICRDGRLVRATGYGLANVELDVPVKPETIFQSGSVGKQFTAMAVMMLVEEGKLGLDDPIVKHFPGAPATWKGITVRHILTHTSGIKDREGGQELDYRKDYTEDELVEVAMKMPPDFAPGTQWSYSNTGYEPERLATAVAGLVEPALAWPDVHVSVVDPDSARTARLREVLEAWAKGVPSPGMAKGLRGTNAATAREKAQREGVQKQLARATGFVFLAEDDEKGRGLERRGETIRTVVYYSLPGERDRRYRFFLNDEGEVADFSSEPVD